MGVDNRLMVAASMVSVVALLAGCGGGGSTPATPPPPPVSAPSAPTQSPPGSPATGPALTLSTASLTAEAVEGGAPITLSLAGATSASGHITWTTSSPIGALSATSSTGAVYTPPAVGGLTAATVIVITATPDDGSAAALQFTISLRPFKIVSTTPASGIADSLSVQPAIEFSRTVDQASLAALAISISSPIAAVPATLAASGAVVTVTPTSGLVWGGHYTVSTAASVSSTLEQTLGTPETFDFDVVAPTWTGATSLNSSVGETPGLLFDHAGGAFGIWQSVTASELQLAHFDLASQTWSAPAILQGTSQVIAPPALAVDDAGDVLAVWAAIVVGSNSYNVYAARYAATAGQWSAPILIQTVADRQVVGPPQLAVDPAGDAMAIWPQSTNSATEYHLYAAHFTAQTGRWDPAIGLSLANDANEPQICFMGGGNATAVWWEGLFSPRIKVARWLSATSSWTASTDMPGSASSSGVKLACAPNGSVTAVWSEYSSGTTSIESARFNSSSGAWGAAQRLSVGAPDASKAPQVKVDLGGNVIVVWRQTTGANQLEINAARFDARSAKWSEPVALESVSDTLWRFAPTLAIDAAGNATAIWDRTLVAGDPSAFYPFYSRYDNHLAKWSTATSIPAAGDLVDFVDATVDDHGDVLTGWSGQRAYAVSWALLGR